MPLAYGESQPSSAAKRGSHLPRVAILGGTRREKGSYLIPDIVRACRSHVDVPKTPKNWRWSPSGVFAEFVALGKPVIATRGTWMSEQSARHSAPRGEGPSASPRSSI